MKLSNIQRVWFSSHNYFYTGLLTFDSQTSSLDNFIAGRTGEIIEIANDRLKVRLDIDRLSTFLVKPEDMQMIGGQEPLE